MDRLTPWPPWRELERLISRYYSKSIEAENPIRFASITLDKVPDGITTLNFRHLLERHDLGKKLFRKINAHLEKQGLSFKEGAIVDAKDFFQIIKIMIEYEI